MELRHDRCVCKREQTLRRNEGDGDIQMKFGGSLLYAAIWWIRYSWAVTGPAKVCRWPASPNGSRLPGGINGRHTSTALVSAVATGTSAARRDLMIGVCKGNEDVWGLSPSSRWTDESGWKKEICAPFTRLNGDLFVKIYTYIYVYILYTRQREMHLFEIHLFPRGKVH